jgi:hypothetical protein
VVRRRVGNSKCALCATGRACATAAPATDASYLILSYRISSKARQPRQNKNNDPCHLRHAATHPLQKLIPSFPEQSTALQNAFLDPVNTTIRSSAFISDWPLRFAPLLRIYPHSCAVTLQLSNPGYPTFSTCRQPELIGAPQSLGANRPSNTAHRISLALLLWSRIKVEQAAKLVTLQSAPVAKSSQNATRCSCHESVRHPC